MNVKKSILSYSNKDSLNSDLTDDQKKLIKYREKINLLHFEAGWGKNRIVRKLGMSKHTVIRWTQSPEQDFTCDKRGWPKGKRRKWSEATEKKFGRFINNLAKILKSFSTEQQQSFINGESNTQNPLRRFERLVKC